MKQRLRLKHRWRARAPTRSPGDAEAGPGGGGSLARLFSHSDGTVCVQVLCTLHSCDHDGVCTDLAPGTRSRAGGTTTPSRFPHLTASEAGGTTDPISQAEKTSLAWIEQLTKATDPTSKKVELGQL